MSIDVQFDAFQALKAGATLANDPDYPAGEVIKIPGYPYVRDCSVILQDFETGQPHRIHLSCNGRFFAFLKEWLNVNEINHEVY